MKIYYFTKERNFVRVSAKAKQKLALDAKIGIVKQLYKDCLITDTQYRYLIRKYTGIKPSA